MAAGVQDDAFDRLHEALQDGNYKKALKCADAVLAKDASDKDALAAKGYALLMSERYGEAAQPLAACKDAPPLDRAYGVWKTDGAQKALELLQDAPDEGSQHLKALLLMRTGQPDEAAGLYQALLPSARGDKQSACEATNTLAAIAMGGAQDSLTRARAALKSAGVAQSESFEAAFNTACAAVAAGDDSAHHLLDAAHTKGQETLVDDDVGEEEMERELAVVRGQQAYLAATAGETAQALETFSQLLQLQLQADPATHAAVTNNVAVLLAQDGKGSVKEAHKKLQPVVSTDGSGKHALSDSLQERLSPAQKTALLRNSAVLSMCGAQPGARGAAAKGIADLARDLAQAEPDSADAMMVAAASAAQAESLDAAEERITQWLKDHEGASALQPLLLAAHLACSAQPPQIAKALTLLRSDTLPEDVRNSPAAVATRVQLLEQKGGSADKAESVQGELQSALEWWQAQSASAKTEQAQAALLMQLAAVRMQRGDSQGGAKAFGRLQELGTDGMDPSTLAQIARGVATTQSGASGSALCGVPKPPTISAADRREAEEYDVAYVRSKGTSVLFGPPVKPASGKTDAEGDTVMKGGEGRQRKKRKRKPRYPKGFDPENPGPPPDPERWLPKHERAAFKKRRKGKNQPLSKGAQGVGKVDAALDSSNVKPDASAASTSTASKPTNRNAPKGSQGKRKGRR